MRIISQEIAEGLDSDDGARDGIIFWNRILDKDLQGFSGAAAKIGKKLSIVEEVTAEDLRDAEYEMPVRNLLEYIHAEPFPEFHHALLVAGWEVIRQLALRSIVLMASCALHALEGLFAVVAEAAALPLVHLGHGHL